jgi:hypothetical protein
LWILLSFHPPGIFLWGLPVTGMYDFLVSLMHATRSLHLTPVNLISLILLGEGTNCEGPSYTVFFTPCYFVYFTSKNSSQHFASKHSDIYSFLRVKDQYKRINSSVKSCFSKGYTIMLNPLYVSLGRFLRPPAYQNMWSSHQKTICDVKYTACFSGTGNHTHTSCPPPTYLRTLVINKKKLQVKLKIWLATVLKTIV